MRNSEIGPRLAPVGAMLALLLATGCGGAEADATTNDSTDNVASSDAGGMDEPDIDDTDMDEPDGGDRGQGRAEAGEMPELPERSAGLGGAEAASLDEAAAIADRIEDGGGIEEIEVPGGAAWLSEGEVVRIANGRRVFYFRPGEIGPFLVQRGNTAYFVADEVATGAINRRGRPVELTDERREQASTIIRRAVSARSRAMRRAEPARSGESDL